MKIKNQKLFKNKKQMVIYIFLFMLIFAGFIYLGNKSYVLDEEDNIIFSSEFKSVSENNIYNYSDARKVLDVLEKDAVILFGSSLNKWTEDVAKMLNEVAIENEIEEILYYDFLDDRNINNGNYELIVNEISSYVYTLDTGDKDIYAPLLLIIKDGKVIYSYDEVSMVKGDVSPEDYWTEYNKNIFKSNLNAAFNIYKEGK